MLTQKRRGAALAKLAHAYSRSPTLLRVRLTSRSSTTPDFEALGVSGTFRGHDGQRKMIATLNEAWERWEMLPAIVLDLGDRALVLGTVRLPGNVSGLDLEREFAQPMTLPGALIAHEQFFFGWDQGLRAAGLDPDAIALLSPKQVSQQASSTRQRPVFATVSRGVSSERPETDSHQRDHNNR